MTAVLIYCAAVAFAATCIVVYIAVALLLLLCSFAVCSFVVVIKNIA